MKYLIGILFVAVVALGFAIYKIHTKPEVKQTEPVPAKIEIFSASPPAKKAEPVEVQPLEIKKGHVVKF